ncbi:MAG: phage holin family protein [Gemmatimonadetes bacterium]|nr:phage holin family protein [Gemmatimonadota bacterium]
MSLLLRLLVNAAALYAATRFVDGISFTGSIPALLGVALVFGIVNTLVKPIIAFFSIPAIFLTLGLFLLVINAVMLLLTASLSRSLGLGFAVRDFWSALLGAVVVSIVSMMLGTFVDDSKPE